MSVRIALTVCCPLIGAMVSPSIDSLTRTKYVTAYFPVTLENRLNHCQAAHFNFAKSRLDSPHSQKQCHRTCGRAAARYTSLYWRDISGFQPFIRLGYRTWDIPPFGSGLMPLRGSCARPITISCIPSIVFIFSLASRLSALIYVSGNVDEFC